MPILQYREGKYKFYVAHHKGNAIVIEAMPKKLQFSMK
jgi:hypothetical protein